MDIKNFILIYFKARHVVFSFKLCDNHYHQKNSEMSQ